MNPFKKYLVFQMSGRLGNNVIQYFYKYKYSEKVIFLNYNVELSKILDIKSSILLDNKIVRFLINFLNKITERKKIIYEDPEKRKLKLFSFFNIVYDQYDMKYLIEAKKKNLVKFNKSYQASVLEKYDLEKQEYIAIHIRGTDFRGFVINGFGFDIALPLSYYRNLINDVKKQNNYPIIICTDDTKRVNDSKLFEDCIVEERSAISDYIILLNSKILITSNSSNSISASILSETVKKVFIPKYGFGQNKKKYIPLVDNKILEDFFGEKVLFVD